MLFKKEFKRGGWEFLIGLVVGMLLLVAYHMLMGFAPIDLTNPVRPPVINFPQNIGITPVESRNKPPAQYSAAKVNWLRHRSGPVMNFPNFLETN